MTNPLPDLATLTLDALTRLTFISTGKDARLSLGACRIVVAMARHDRELPYDPANAAKREKLARMENAMLEALGGKMYSDDPKIVLSAARLILRACYTPLPAATHPDDPLFQPAVLEQRAHVLESVRGFAVENLAKLINDEDDAIVLSVVRLLAWIDAKANPVPRKPKRAKAKNSADLGPCPVDPQSTDYYNNQMVEIETEIMAEIADDLALAYPALAGKSFLEMTATGSTWNLSEIDKSRQPLHGFPLSPVPAEVIRYICDERYNRFAQRAKIHRHQFKEWHRQFIKATQTGAAPPPRKSLNFLFTPDFIRKHTPGHP